MGNLQINAHPVAGSWRWQESVLKQRVSRAGSQARGRIEQDLPRSSVFVEFQQKSRNSPDRFPRIACTVAAAPCVFRRSPCPGVRRSLCPPESSDSRRLPRARRRGSWACHRREPTQSQGRKGLKQKCRSFSRLPPGVGLHRALGSLPRGRRNVIFGPCVTPLALPVFHGRK